MVKELRNLSNICLIYLLFESLICGACFLQENNVTDNNILCCNLQNLCILNLIFKGF